MMGVGMVPEELNGSSLLSSRSASRFYRTDQRTLMGIISMLFAGDENIPWGQQNRREWDGLATNARLDGGVSSSQPQGVSERGKCESIAGSGALHDSPKLEMRAGSKTSFLYLSSCLCLLSVQHSLTATSLLPEKLFWLFVRSRTTKRSGRIAMGCSNSRGKNFGHNSGLAENLLGLGLGQTKWGVEKIYR